MKFSIGNCDRRKKSVSHIGWKSGIPVEIRADEEGFFAGLLLVCNLNEHQFNVYEGNINVRGKNQRTFFPSRFVF